MFQARLVVDLGAIVANWLMFARMAGSRAGAAAVVKADGYGLGAGRVAAALAAAGCRRFYVAWPHEAAALRTAIGRGPQIAVFHGVTSDTLDAFVEHNLEPVLNSLVQIETWIAAGCASKPASLHLDTGMNRLGVPCREWSLAASRFPEPRFLLSHLACADEADHSANRKQLEIFTASRKFWPGALQSLSATAGALLGSDFILDEVRPGIGLYGGRAFADREVATRPVVRIEAPIIQVRTLQPGECVGYGGTWVAASPTTVATIGLGYADGFLRSASNRGMAWVAGARRPILGRVSMDMVAIDVTGLPAKAGDAVEFLGPNLQLADVSASMGTIDYEVLTRLGSRFVRSYAD